MTWRLNWLVCVYVCVSVVVFSWKPSWWGHFDQSTQLQRSVWGRVKTWFYWVKLWQMVLVRYLVVMIKIREAHYVLTTQTLNHKDRLLHQIKSIWIFREYHIEIITWSARKTSESFIFIALIQHFENFKNMLKDWTRTVETGRFSSAKTSPFITVAHSHHRQILYKFQI